jgi:hypothetical protein
LSLQPPENLTSIPRFFRKNRKNFSPAPFFLVKALMGGLQKTQNQEQRGKRVMFTNNKFRRVLTVGFAAVMAIGLWSGLSGTAEARGGRGGHGFHGHYGHRSYGGYRNYRSWGYAPSYSYGSYVSDYSDGDYGDTGYYASPTYYYSSPSYYGGYYGHRNYGYGRGHFGHVSHRGFGGGRRR